MAVFREKKGHELRMYGLVRTEVSAEETAYQVAVYRGVIAWEMYVFEIAEKAFEIISESFYLG